MEKYLVTVQDLDETSYFLLDKKQWELLTPETDFFDPGCSDNTLQDFEFFFTNARDLITFSVNNKVTIADDMIVLSVR